MLYNTGSQFHRKKKIQILHPRFKDHLKFSFTLPSMSLSHTCSKCLFHIFTLIICSNLACIITLEYTMLITESKTNVPCFPYQDLISSSFINPNTKVLQDSIQILYPSQSLFQPV